MLHRLQEKLDHRNLEWTETSPGWLNLGRLPAGSCTGAKPWGMGNSRPWDGYAGRKFQKKGIAISWLFRWSCCWGPNLTPGWFGTQILSWVLNAWQRARLDGPFVHHSKYIFGKIPLSPCSRTPRFSPGLLLPLGWLSPSFKTVSLKGPEWAHWPTQDSSYQPCQMSEFTAQPREILSVFLQASNCS